MAIRRDCRFCFLSLTARKKLTMVELILYIAVFLALSGLMACVEAAVLSVSPGEVEEMRLRKARGARALTTITQHMTQALVVIVILTNTINILGPVLSGYKAIQLYGDVAIVWITTILTIGTIVFSEIIPKSLGSHYAPQVGRLAAPALKGLIYLFYPIVMGLEWSSNLFKTGQRRLGTEVQIRSLVTIGKRAGHIERDEGQLIRRAFVLNDRTAANIMTHRKEMICVAGTSNIRQAASQVFRHAFSRYPVLGKSIHDIRGLVMSRDILTALTEGKDNEPVSTICRPCLNVPASMRSDELLAHFRDRRIHLAVVEDHQRTVGLVTLEDVLEELIGEIEDEKDRTP
jgi:putative hemolysin